MNQLKEIYCILFFCSTFYGYSQKPTVEHLKIEINSIGDVLTLPQSGGFTVSPYYGVFKMLKITLENTDIKTIELDFNNFYIIDNFGDKYPFSHFYAFARIKKKLKPGKSIKRILYFDFPSDSEPEILQIDDIEISLK